MPNPIRVLILEDRSNDAELVVHELRRAGFEPDWQRIDTENDFVSHLDSLPDLIVADYGMPQFNAVKALERVRESGLEIPVVIVSGSTGEETAVEAMRHGAADYLVKDRLSRLGQAVTHALEQKRLRQEKRRAEAALRTTQQRLLQAQKLDAIGQLAGSVAIDFNQILTVIHGYIHLLLMKPNFDAETKEDLSEVYLATERAANLTRQLLTFSRNQVFERGLLNLNEVVIDLSKILRRVISEDVNLSFSYASDLPRVYADAGMLQQVLLNLAANARDAMAQGGRLFISTAAAEIDPEYVDQQPQARPGTFVRLTVRDTGCGMTPEVQARIFEPFFTTKGVGQGTGLGLATVYGIVKQHEGWVEVESQAGVGTTFNVFLPGVGLAPSPTRGSSLEAEVRGGNETILLVEAERPVRELARTVLEQYGYRVVEARSAAVGLSIWDEHSADVDLLLTDMVTPDGVNGWELAGELSRRKPGLRVIYTTVYSPSLASEGVQQLGETKFLQKPYAPRTLVQMVRRCLDEKPV